LCCNIDFKEYPIVMTFKCYTGCLSELCYKYNAQTKMVKDSMSGHRWVSFSLG